MCVLWWMALLCFAKRRTLISLFEHVENRFGLVLIMLFGHRVQFEFECILGQERFLR